MSEQRVEAGTDLIREGEAHVWSVLLDVAFPSEEQWARCLSEEERRRASTFALGLQRDRFIRSRIALREILARYHGLSPSAVRLQREQGGRPYVEGDHRLRFSLTHSGGLALVALSNMPVGVDVERPRSVRRMARIAGRVLHSETAQLLRSLDGEAQTLAFIDAWTQREAHVKALGGGVFRTADDLPFEHEQRHGLVIPALARSTGEAWSIVRLHHAGGWRAAVVARGVLHRVVERQWISRSQEQRNREE